MLFINCYAVLFEQSGLDNSSLLNLFFLPDSGVLYSPLFQFQRKLKSE